MPEISVICPVYKAEKYLHKCVDSILSQTFTDFELLLIDDGSPDRSGQTCDEYAAKDNRVRVFHKENGGVSSARQTGLDHARGEYVIHADPDDWVEKEMLDALYQKAKEDNADMLICDYYMNTGFEQAIIRQQPSALDHTTVLSELFGRLHGSCCNKLVRRCCFDEFDIRFPEKMDLSEDLFVCISLLLHPIKISYMPHAFYHYVQDANANTLSRGRARKTAELLLCKKRQLRQLLDGTVWECALRRLTAYDAYTQLYLHQLSEAEYVHNYKGIEGVIKGDFQLFCAILALRHYRTASLLVLCRRLLSCIYHKIGK